jgi:hypothetical protein
MPSPHSHFLELATELDDLVQTMGVDPKPADEVMDKAALVAARAAIAFCVDLTSSLDKIAMGQRRMEEKLGQLAARI